MQSPAENDPLVSGSIYCEGGQLLQEVHPVVRQYVPHTQVLQVLISDAPVKLLYLPATQPEHVALDVAPVAL